VLIPQMPAAALWVHGDGRGLCWAGAFVIVMLAPVVGGFCQAGSEEVCWRRVFCVCAGDVVFRELHAATDYRHEAWARGACRDWGLPTCCAGEPVGVFEFAEEQE